MYIKATFDSDFDGLMMHLFSKYPKKLFNLEGIGEQTDISKFSKSFFTNSSSTADVSVDDNSNVDDKSVIAYTAELPKPLFKYNSYFVLWKRLKQLYSHEIANNIIEKQISGDIYINDLHGVGAGMPYCFNYSTLDIALFGLPMVKKVRSSPPKHLFAFKSQMEQFITIASNSSLGATGTADLFLTLSIYVNKILKTGSDAGFYFKSEDDIWRYVKENITSFVYTVNQPMRASQSPFTNVSVYDDFFLDEIIDTYNLYVDDQRFDATKETVKRVQEIYLDVMNAEMDRTAITFPIPTACFSIDEDRNLKDLDFLDMISEKNLKYGFINIYNGDSSTLSSCCRLRSDMQTIGYQNSIGGSGTKIGSLGVCTLNLPRLAFKYSNVDDFFKHLEPLIHDGQRVNHAKRKIIQKRIDNRHAPMYNHHFMDIDKQYSTVGIIGLNECLEILGYDIVSEDGQRVALRIMKMIKDVNNCLSKKYSAPHNVEQIPGESASVKLASKDRLLKYNDGRYDLYSNQFIPLTKDVNILDRLHLQGKFDQHFDGGSIAHINLDMEVKSVDVMKRLIKKGVKCGAVYFAINYVINSCKNFHMSVGKDLKICPVCGEVIVEKYTRVVGFLTNIKDWNETRRVKDFPNRHFQTHLE